MEGAECEVFSLSQNKWISGIITKRLNRGYVRVQYGRDSEKDIHIDHEHLRLTQHPNTVENHHEQEANKENELPLDTDIDAHTSSPHIGTQCEIYSQSQRKWMDGIIWKLLQDDHVRVRYGHDLEKDIHLDSEDLTILHETFEEQTTSRTMYYAEGMLVETFVDRYGEWLKGTITRANDDSHSVEIELEPQQDVDEVGTIHIVQDDQQKLIRPDQEPLLLKRKSPRSILTRSSGYESKDDLHADDAVQIFSSSNNEWFDGVIVEYLENDNVRVASDSGMI